MNDKNGTYGVSGCNIIPKQEATIFTNVAVHNHAVTEGVLKAMSNAVSASYGPTGANTLMIKEFTDERTGNTRTFSHPSKDGFAILTSLVFEHPACKSIKDLMCSNMMNVLQNAGDGTTTTTILISKLYTRLQNLFTASRIPAQSFINMCNTVLSSLYEEMNKLDKTVSYEDIKNLIRTASNNDEAICDVLYKALDETTNDGEELNRIAIHFRRNPSLDHMRYTKRSGFNIPAGAIVAHGTILQREPTPMNVVLINRRIGSAEDLSGLRTLVKELAYHQYLKQNSPEVLLMTYEIENKSFVTNEFIRALRESASENGMSELPKIHLLEFPKVGTTLSHEEHNDIEFILGQYAAYDLGKSVKAVFSEEYTGYGEDLSMNEFIISRYAKRDLPICKVGLNRTSTVISDFSNVPLGNKESLLTSLMSDLEADGTPESKKEIEARLKNINGNYIDLEIGGINQWDVNRKADAIEDCVGAIRAALEGGICGGMSSFIPKLINMTNLEFKSEIHQNILKEIYHSYDEIFTEAIEKCGMMNTSVFSEEILHTDNIKLTADMRKIIDMVVKTQDGSEGDVRDALTEEVLNTIASERKILEAGVSAVTTLLGINQILLPLTGDVKQYKDGLGL